MSEEKIVYIPNTNILRHDFFAFLFFKQHYVLASLTLVHNPTIFLLPFVVLTRDKKLSKNNLEVNL
tara:strand:+ start:5879 stop:6076 length:198 start_codon:yes stop_codon:yes gene_type:complete